MYFTCTRSFVEADYAVENIERESFEVDIECRGPDNHAVECFPDRAFALLRDHASRLENFRAQVPLCRPGHTVRRYAAPSVLPSVESRTRLRELRGYPQR